MTHSLAQIYERRQIITSVVTTMQDAQQVMAQAAREIARLREVQAELVGTLRYLAGRHICDNYIAPSDISCIICERIVAALASTEPIT